ncbi:hypothetical protein BKA93DRAFT_88299 [Sparassis latifolia]
MALLNPLHTDLLQNTYFEVHSARHWKMGHRLLSSSASTCRSPGHGKLLRHLLKGGCALGHQLCDTHISSLCSQPPGTLPTSELHPPRLYRTTIIIVRPYRCHEGLGRNPPSTTNTPGVLPPARHVDRVRGRAIHRTPSSSAAACCSSSRGTAARRAARRIQRRRRIRLCANPSAIS